MPNFQEKGIYSGGVVTKGSSPDNTIKISPYILNLVGGGVTGGGEASSGVSKSIKINFGGVLGGNAFRESVKAPIYNIFTGPGPGQVFIYYSETAADLAFSTVAQTNKIVFARVYWNSTASDMTAIQIDTSYVDPLTAGPNRTEAYLAQTQEPENPSHMYFDSMKFMGGNLNKPLANMAVTVEVLQNVYLSLYGGSYFITLAKDSDMFASGSQIKLKVCKHIRRTENNGYFTYHTKENPIYGVNSGIALSKTFTLNGVSDGVIGTNVLAVVEASTGIPNIVRESDLGALGITLDTTHFLVAKSVAPLDGNSVIAPSLGSLNDLVFEAVKTGAGSAAVSNLQATYIKNQLPSGFLNKFDITSAGPDSLTIPNLIGNIEGYVFDAPTSVATLPEAPISGTRQDFVYAQINRDDTGIKNIYILTTANVDYLTYPDPFDNPIVKSYKETDNTPDSRTGLPFTYNSKGYYEATNIDPVSTLRYFALPIAVVHRFNQGAANSVNPNGGVNRIDEKTYDILDEEEILNLSPFIATDESRALLLNSVRLALTGSLNNRLQESLYSSGVLSRKPLQVDYLSSHTEGLLIGDTNGGRRLWSGNTSKSEVLGSSFIVGNAHNTPYIDYTYVNATSNTLQLRIPNSPLYLSNVLVDVESQPDVSVKWAVDGTDVVLTGPWIPAFDTDGYVTQCNNSLDTTDAGYISKVSANTARICVSYKVQHRTPSGLTRPPLDFMKASLGGANGKAFSFAITPDTANNPSLYKVLNKTNSRQVIIASQVYRDSLYVLRSGSPAKGYAMELHYVMAGNGLATTAYNITDTYVINSTDFPLEGGTYRLLNLIDVRDKNGNSLNPSKVQWNPGTPSVVPERYEITLGVALSVNEPVYFIFGLDGLQLDYSAGALEISNLTSSELNNYSPQIPSSGTLLYSYYNGSDVMQNGVPLFGMSSYKNKNYIFAEKPGGLYQNLPVRVTGFGTGLLKIDTVITAVEYGNLNADQQACYQSVGLDYKIITGTAIRFSFTRALSVSGSIVFVYKYGSLPFTEYDPNIAYKIKDDGVLILSNDGTGNESSGSQYSPLSERFPVVQNVSVIGQGLETQPIGINPIIHYNQDGLQWISPGDTIDMTGKHSLGVFIETAQGLAVWACLVQTGVKLQMFIYQVRDGKFVVNNKDQAFISELEYITRGL